MNQIKGKKILVSVITCRTEWRKLIDEINDFGISEIALFLTTATHHERQLIFQALENSCVKTIPLVHLRHDMERKECDYLIQKFGTEVFNIHPMPETLELVLENKDLAENIFVENSFTVPPLFFKVLEHCSGICLDITHLEAFGHLQESEGYKKFKDILGTKKIGMTHLGAVLKEAYLNEDDPPRMVLESHRMYDLSNFDYLKGYVKYFAEYNAIEVNNSIKEQLAAKEYIEKNILQVSS